MTDPSHILQNVKRPATLDMVFSYKKGKTILSHVYCESPFKITRLYYPEHSSLPQLILMNNSPGLLAGDCWKLRITVEAGAKIIVTSQSSAKIHPSRDLPSFHSTVLYVEREGALHYYNDPIIPFAQSRLRQTIDIHVEAGARLYYWDGIMSGRVLRNEQWKFTELSSETKIVENQYLLYLDRFSLFPAEQNLTKEWILSNYHYLANALVYDCQLTPSLCQSFQALLCSGQSGLSGAFDLPVQSLLSGRILSLEGTRFQTIQQKFRKLLFETLLGELNPRVRK